jgi:hypothetical protein
LYLGIVDHNHAQLFEIYLCDSQSSTKSLAPFSWAFCPTIWPQKGGKKLGVRNCAQLPINEKLCYLYLWLVLFQLKTLLEDKSVIVELNEFQPCTIGTQNLIFKSFLTRMLDTCF